MPHQVILSHMPRHLKRWIQVAQRLPVALMALFTLAVVFNTSPVGTMATLNRWGVSNLEFGSACAVSTVYLFVATRKLSWQAAIHYVLGTLPVLFFTLLTIFLSLSGGLPFTAFVIYLFTYVALAMLYWLAIALAEWADGLEHRLITRELEDR